MLYPTRKIVLIGAQTPKAKHLTSIYGDLESQNDYYRSPNAGAWKDHEIEILYDEPWRKVEKTVRNAIADYTIISVSSHGYTNPAGELMVCLRDSDIPVGAFLNNSHRQSIYVDACRSYHEGGTIGSIPWPKEQWLYATGYSFARQLYNQYISDSAFGKTILYATNAYNEAWSDEQRNGGHFTLSMLDVVRSLQDSGEKGVLHIEQAVQYAYALLKQRNVPQIPSFVYKEGHLNVPFAILSPTFVNAAPRRITRKPIEQTSSVNQFLGIAGVILAAYGLSKII